MSVGLQGLTKHEDLDTQLSVMQCLKILVLRGDSLRLALDADPEYLAYLQEIFIPK